MVSDSDLRVDVFMVVDLDVFPKVCDEDAERLVAVSNFGRPREFVQTFECFLLHVEHGNVGSAFGEIADNLAPELSCPNDDGLLPIQLRSPSRCSFRRNPSHPVC